MAKNTKGKTAKLAVERLVLVGKGAVKPHPDNPRKHPQPDTPEWNALKRSLLNVYFDPLVVNKRTNTLISGHLRRKILISEGYSIADMTVVSVTPKKHIAMMIAANQNQGDNDLDALAGLLEGMDAGDLAVTGFSDDELDTLMGEGNTIQQVEVLLDQAVQLKPSKEYIVIVCEDSEEFDRLRDELGLRIVRAGGYKPGSPWDKPGIERVVQAKRVLDKIGE